MILRVLIALCAVLGGALVAITSVAVHGYWWGLALGLAAPLATVVALPRGWWRRLAFAVGWSGMVVVLSDSRPEGDFLVRADARGYLLLAGTVVVLLSGLVGVRYGADAGREDTPS